MRRAIVGVVLFIMKKRRKEWKYILVYAHPHEPSNRHPAQDSYYLCLYIAMDALLYICKTNVKGMQRA